MHTHRVNVLDEANGDNVIFCVTDDFQFEFFPAGDAFFDEHLANDAGLETAFTDGLEFINIVYDAAAGTAHGVSWTKNDRIVQFFGDLDGFINAVSDFAARHLDTELLHLVFELDTVFAAFDGIDLDADNFYVEFIQNACFRKLRTEVEPALTTKVWQEGVWTFFFDDLSEAVNIQWFDVGDVSDIRVGHDRCWVRVDQNDLIAQLFQRFACLGTRIVKFTCLTDNDRAGANDHDLMDVL